MQINGSGWRHCGPAGIGFPERLLPVPPYVAVLADIAHLTALNIARAGKAGLNILSMQARPYSRNKTLIRLRAGRQSNCARAFNGRLGLTATHRHGVWSRRAN
jgi:hypothetical protein